MSRLYDRVALALVARMRWEIVAYSTTNLVARLLCTSVVQVDSGLPQSAAALPHFVLATHLTAFILVMLKPNVGATPAWLAWLGARFPRLRTHG